MPTGRVAAVSAAGEGFHRVGTGSGELQPGRYRWAGGAPGSYCGWLLLNSRNGGPASIVSFAISHGEPLTTQVAADIRFVQVQGNCTFRRVG